MLGYASPSTVASRRFSPTSIALIVAGHAALLALVISSRMEVLPKSLTEPTIYVPIPDPVPPPPKPPTAERPSAPSSIPGEQPTVTPPLVPDLPLIGGTPGEEVTVPTDPFPGGEVVIPPPPEPREIVRRAATLATPELRLRPPYPLSKQRLGEEASLALRLTIGADGRVSAVAPAGPADPVFLAAARRHILAHWRYRPATEDGAPVATVLIVQLSFKLADG